MRKTHNVVGTRRARRERLEMIPAMLLWTLILTFFGALGWAVAFPDGKVSEVMVLILSIGQVFL